MSDVGDAVGFALLDLLPQSLPLPSVLSCRVAVIGCTVKRQSVVALAIKLKSRLITSDMYTKCNNKMLRTVQEIYSKILCACCVVCACVYVCVDVQVCV